MRWLINYLRECFCKHDFEITQQKQMRAWVKGWQKTDDIKVFYICKKCGYHKSWWKFY